MVSVRLNADAMPWASSGGRNAETIRTFSEMHQFGESFIDVPVPGWIAAARPLYGVNMCRIALARYRGDATVAIVAGPRSWVKAVAGRTRLNLNHLFGLRAPMGNEHVNTRPCR